MPVGARRKPDRKSHGQYQSPSKWFIGSLAKTATPLYYKLVSSHNGLERGIGINQHHDFLAFEFVKVMIS
jgi:hypothetical protein